MGEIEKELTILIPCLNEEETLGMCIQKAKQMIQENKVEAEILIVDNGSTDQSVTIAKEMGVRVIIEKQIGYGSALQRGTKEAVGKYIIMGDADDSYDFLQVMSFLEKLRAGYELVVGNRYKGKIEKGAMKFTHQYIGTPIISKIARIKYNITQIHDFNCGLRGYQKDAILKLDCQASGMEYASEMIIKAKQANLKITEIPIHFYCDQRKKKPHLRTIPDGVRHMKLILLSSNIKDIENKLTKGKVNNIIKKTNEK